MFTDRKPSEPTTRTWSLDSRVAADRLGWGCVLLSRVLPPSKASASSPFGGLPHPPHTVAQGMRFRPVSTQSQRLHLAGGWSRPCHFRSVIADCSPSPTGEISDYMVSCGNNGRKNTMLLFIQNKAYETVITTGKRPVIPNSTLFPPRTPHRSPRESYGIPTDPPKGN